MLRRSVSVILFAMAASPAMAAADPPSPFSLEATFEAGAQPFAPWGGDIRRLSAGYAADLAEGIRFDLRARLDREWTEPATNQDLIRHLQERTNWLLRGGMPPSLLLQMEEVALTIEDPQRNGRVRLGQFYRPFGYSDFHSFDPPPAIAPTRLPMLSSLSPLTQPSTLTYGRDIGLMLAGQASGYAYTVAVLNGSGPDRMDDNAQKDWLLRLDLAPNEQSEIGLSYQSGFDYSFLESAPFHRQDWNIHAKFVTEDYVLKGEYVIAHRLGLDQRRGWYLDFSGDGNSYLQGGESRDLTRGYDLRFATVGWRKTVQDGLIGGVEYTSFWESLPGRNLQSNRVLSWLGLKL